MKILALQLKRIGDLVLTTPALRALRAAWPEAHIALGVSEGCASLLGAIETIDSAIVFGRGRGWAPWQQVFTGGWDLCLDFTGTDRSAAASWVSRSKDRWTFEWVRRRRLRSLAYRDFVESPVRERHTADHYLDLADAVIRAADLQFVPPAERIANPLHVASLHAAPELRISERARATAGDLLRAHGIAQPFAILHPGTARAEKYWLADRWAKVADALAGAHGFAITITCGPAAFERAHAAEIQSAIREARSAILRPDDLLTLAALVERAAIVISCDTGIVHLAAAFRRPQIALFGPTNPFHWRPRHERALVFSASQPEAPMTDFEPRMKGAPMDRISTEAVIRATEVLLSQEPGVRSQESE